MTVKDIIIQYLKENGFEGLVDIDNECGCLVDDLAPCFGSDLTNCEPAYKHPGEEGYDFMMYRRKALNSGSLSQEEEVIKVGN